LQEKLPRVTARLVRRAPFNSQGDISLALAD